jgi:hypothetical protein
MAVRSSDAASPAGPDEGRVADLLREVAETHHRVYRKTDGADPDWPIWYAGWLVDLSELPEVLGRTPVRSELVHLLVELDREVTEQAPTEPWPDYYARRIAQRFGG